MSRQRKEDYVLIREQLKMKLKHDEILRQIPDFSYATMKAQMDERLQATNMGEISVHAHECIQRISANKPGVSSEITRLSFPMTPP